MVLVKKLLKNEAGQSVILLALVFIVLCIVAAFAVDIGRLSAAKSQLQNAADSAALSGAMELPLTSAAINTAVGYAGLNGVGETELSVSTPYNGDLKKIEVVCTQTVEYTFARVLGFTSASISARAVAERSGMSGGPFDYAVFHGNTTNGLMFSTSSLSIEGSVHSNSTLQLNGSSQTITAAEAVSNFYAYGSTITIDTCRGASITAHGSNINITNQIISPAPVIDMPDFSDQVQLDAESGGQVYTGYTMFNGNSINVDSPLYVDGDLMFSGSQINGQGVILATGDIQFNGSSIVNSSNDAVCFYSANGDIQVNGSNVQLDGIIYAPNGTIQINASSVVINGRLIADKIQLNGSSISICPQEGDLECLPANTIKLVE